jgi:hypothetical protein
VIAK